VRVNDPASETFYGASRQMSGIEIPDPDSAFYSPQNERFQSSVRGYRDALQKAGIKATSEPD
jgi:hypothetical protein